ncbi:hypothetical protein OROMI_013331 [Orobanche minor]
MCLGENAFVEIFAKVSPYVVSFSDNTFPDPQTSYAIATCDAYKWGSGIIISDYGLILTCDHMFKQYSGSLRRKSHLTNVSHVLAKIDVHTHDHRMLEGSLIFADISEHIAIVEVKSHDPPLSVATNGRSSSLVTGEWVAAISCPNACQDTLTHYII